MREIGSDRETVLTARTRKKKYGPYGTGRGSFPNEVARVKQKQIIRSGEIKMGTGREAVSATRKSAVRSDKDTGKKKKRETSSRK